MRKLRIPSIVLAAAAILALSLLAPSCATHEEPAAAKAPAAVFPGGEWDRIASPEKAGWSKAGLDAVVEHVKTLPTTGLMVVHGGRVLLEYGDVIELSYLASVRKSVLAMLYGNYVAGGQVRLDKTLAELGITDHGGLTDREREATIADLLSARSGVYHPASNAGDNLADAPPRGSQKHGEYFLYSNWDFNALGAIFEQETGRNIYDALETDLAVPVGMQDFEREGQRKSGNLKVSMHPAYHIWLSTRDMARLGYLMLRQGNWAGRQLVPRDWVERITSPITRLPEMNPARMREGRVGYGYLWWVFDGPWGRGPYEGAYTGMGAGGQYITVLPALDLVVAHKTNRAKTQGKSVSGGQYFEFLDKIVAARLER
ncbi:MAG TPA: class C beta-lactamase-related serine hydrolase [Candidatus Aminicenantes bacterium]|mgnify:CR=1 FL=1|nr:class C beta-lactamase-related serine hydrolase [Candidatus Aminicenantes bacterium]